MDRVHAALSPTQPGDCHIDLTKCQYLGPDAIALLAAIVLDRRYRGHRVDVSLPGGPAKLRAFCRFSGFDALVNDEPAPTDVEEPVIPLRQIREARWGDADPIIALVKRHLEIPDDPAESVVELLDELRTCVNEVVQNIQDHAASPIGGVLSARFMKGDRHVRVAIVDRGMGICTTLQRRHPDTTPGNALQRVLRGDYSALSRPNNRGLGLSILRDRINYVKGDFVLLSGVSGAHCRGGYGNKFFMMPHGLPGTAVFFTLPVGVSA